MPSVSTSARPPTPEETSPGARRETVLRAFTARAAHAGIKAVVMAELAADLHMSTKTLYRLYPSKAHLVTDLVRNWIRTMTEEQDSRIRSVDEPVARMKAAVHAGLEHVERFRPAFWADLARDYPEAHAEYRDAIGSAFARAARWIERELRPGMSMAVAGPLLVSAIRTAADPDLCDRAGITRREAIDAAIEIWAGGALARGAGGVREDGGPTGARGPTPTPQRREERP